MILFDTAPIVAAAFRSEEHHEACTELFTGLRLAGLVAQYSDLRLGTTDASVIARAERLDVTEIATLDRRHFTAVRPRHVESFTLLPERL